MKTVTLLHKVKLLSAIVRTSSIKHAHKRVIGAMLEFANGRLELWPSSPVLAGRAEMCESQLRRAIPEMESLGYIERTKRPGIRCTVYRITRQFVERFVPDLEPCAEPAPPVQQTATPTCNNSARHHIVKTPEPVESEPVESINRSPCPSTTDGDERLIDRVMKAFLESREKVFGFSEAFRRKATTPKLRRDAQRLLATCEEGGPFGIDCATDAIKRAMKRVRALNGLPPSTPMFAHHTAAAITAAVVAEWHALTGAAAA